MRAQHSHPRGRGGGGGKPGRALAGRPNFAGGAANFKGGEAAARGRPSCCEVERARREVLGRRARGMRRAGGRGERGALAAALARLALLSGGSERGV